MSDEPRRAPREISEAQSFEILAGCRAEIPERVCGFLAAADLELEDHYCPRCQSPHVAIWTNGCGRIVTQCMECGASGLAHT